MVKQVRAVSGFTGIRCGGPITIKVKFGAKESVIVDGEDATLLPYLETYVDPRNQQILQIRLPEEYYSLYQGALQVTVTACTLESVEIFGRGNITIESPVSAPSFSVVVAGGGEITATVNASQLQVFLLEYGAVRLAGQVCDAQIVVDGRGTVSGEKLAASMVTADVKGCGQVYVRALDSLMARVQRGGGVQYSGSPQVSSLVTGTGSAVKPYFSAAV